MKKKLMVLAMTVFGMLFSWAGTPTVTDVVAKQRYPWNGLVDISCKVTGIEGSNGYRFVLVAVDKESGKEYTTLHFSVEQGGTGVSGWEVTTNSDYKLLWDARADLGQIVCERMIVRVTLEAGVSKGKVQLWEGGPYWATTNIGAEKPEDYGYYFWWGDTVGYKRKNDAWVASDGSSSNFSFKPDNTPTYGKSIGTLQSEGWIVSQDGSYVLAPEHDAAQVQWGGGWRMPTYQELRDLCHNMCDWTWTTQNGVNGYIVRGRGDYASNSIFIPCAGYGSVASLYGAGSHGSYWSSVPDSDSNEAYGLSFNSSYLYTSDYCRYAGHSVRPVQGFTK